MFQEELPRHQNTKWLQETFLLISMWDSTGQCGLQGQKGMVCRCRLRLMCSTKRNQKVLTSWNNGMLHWMAEPENHTGELTEKSGNWMKNSVTTWCIRPIKQAVQLKLSIAAVHCFKGQNGLWTKKNWKRWRKGQSISNWTRQKTLRISRRSIWRLLKCRNRKPRKNTWQKRNWRKRLHKRMLI